MCLPGLRICYGQGRSGPETKLFNASNDLAGKQSTKSCAEAQPCHKRISTDLGFSMQAQLQQVPGRLWGQAPPSNVSVSNVCGADWSKKAQYFSADFYYLHTCDAFDPAFRQLHPNAGFRLPDRQKASRVTLASCCVTSCIRS